MGRGNSWDHRLDRMAQVAILIMESLSSFEHKFVYSLYGQSGSSACVMLWDPEVPRRVADTVGPGKTTGPQLPAVFRPPTAAERASIIQDMYSHAMSCSTGDNTLPATALAVKEVVCPRGLAGSWSALPGMAPVAPADDYFVFVFSDANLGRYGTDPKVLDLFAFMCCVSVTAFAFNFAYLLKTFLFCTVSTGRAASCLS